jgi:predicted amidohydrolase
MPCQSDLNWELNLEYITQYCQEACQSAPQVVVLPEYFVCYGNFDRYHFSQHHGQEILSYLGHLAQSLRIILFAGSFHTCGLSSGLQKIYNTLYVFDAQGRCVSHYHKIHVFDFDHGHCQESKHHLPGSHPQRLVLQNGSYALGISYDVRFAEQFRASVPFDVLVLPAAFLASTGQAH